MPSIRITMKKFWEIYDNGDGDPELAVRVIRKTTFPWWGRPVPMTRRPLRCGVRTGFDPTA